MKILFSFILSFIFLVFWSCSDTGDPLSNDCTEGLDCAGKCGGTATIDVCGECDGSGLNNDNCCGNSSSCVHYSTEIQPIFTANCTNCHVNLNLGDLSLSSYDDLMENDVVDPGDSAASKLIQRLKETSGTRMPQNQDPLDEATINLIETWIDEGALDN